jgi:hypothetical protein
MGPGFDPQEAHPVHVAEQTGLDQDPPQRRSGAAQRQGPLAALRAQSVWPGQPAARDFLSLAGPGFRDFTRIAASDPTVWRDILLANREELVKQLKQFRQALDAMEYVMGSGNADALEQLIRAASTARAGWTMNTGKTPPR